MWHPSLREPQSADEGWGGDHTQQIRTETDRSREVKMCSRDPEVIVVRDEVTVFETTEDYVGFGNAGLSMEHWNFFGLEMVGTEDIPRPQPGERYLIEFRFRKIPDTQKVVA